MDNRDDIDDRWSAAGELVLWVILFFVSVWAVNAFLPAQAEQTPLEVYLGRQLGPQLRSANGRDVPAQFQTPDGQNQWGQPPGPPGHRR